MSLGESSLGGAAWGSRDLSEDPENLLVLELAAAETEAHDARQLLSELEREAKARTVRGRRRRRTSTWWSVFGAAKALVGLKERAVCEARCELERARA